jgi:hypothetical protein
MGSDVGLISGGSGGYVNLSSPSSSEAVSEPIVSPSFTGGSPTINFSGASNNSILSYGILALAAIFLVKEIA